MSDWIGPVMALVGNAATGVIGVWMFRTRAGFSKQIQDNRMRLNQLEYEHTALKRESEECAKDRTVLSADVTVLKARNASLQAEIDELALALTDVNKTNVGAFVKVDRQGVIREWNPGATMIFGWSSLEAIGKSITILIPPDVRQVHHNAFHSLSYSDRQPRKDPIVAKAKTRNGRDIDVTINLSRWSEGELTWFGAEIHQISPEEFARTKTHPAQESNVKD